MKITVPQKCYRELMQAEKKAEVSLIVGPEHERLSLYRLTATINEDGEVQKEKSAVYLGVSHRIFEDLEDFYNLLINHDGYSVDDIESISAEIILPNIFDIGLAYIGPNDKGYDEPGENKYNRICDEPGSGIHLTVSKV